MEKLFAEFIAYLIFGAALYGVAYIWSRISKRDDKNENSADTTKREE